VLWGVIAENDKPSRYVHIPQIDNQYLASHNFMGNGNGNGNGNGIERRIQSALNSVFSLPRSHIFHSPSPKTLRPVEPMTTYETGSRKAKHFHSV
jgi:hypothetical protein